MATISERNTHAGRGGRGRGNPWHNGSVDLGSGQGIQFFPHPRKYRRVAALQAHHRFTFAGEFDHQLADLSLRYAVMAAGFAHVVALAAVRNQRQHVIAHQTVIHHGVRLHKQACGLEG